MALKRISELPASHHLLPCKSTWKHGTPRQKSPERFGTHLGSGTYMWPPLVATGTKKHTFAPSRFPFQALTLPAGAHAAQRNGSISLGFQLDVPHVQVQLIGPPGNPGFSSSGIASLPPPKNKKRKEKEKEEKQTTRIPFRLVPPQRVVLLLLLFLPPSPKKTKIQSPRLPRPTPDSRLP